jgi:hypothetical protein
MLKTRNRSSGAHANGAHIDHSFAHQSRNGEHGADPPEKERAPRYGRSSSGNLPRARKADYNGSEEGQAQSRNGHLPRQGCKASVHWSRDQYRALCRLMLNGNPDFMLVYWHEKKCKAVFPRAYQAKVAERVEWAFDVMCGTGSDRKTGIGFYPCNSEGQSCWAALDFDAHQGRDADQAYALAQKAFAFLRAKQDLAIIACTSGKGGGWHVFIFAEQPHSIGEWSRLLREVAEQINSPVQDGICEIFPNDAKRGLQKGIRAPGSWNAKDDSFGLIAFDSLTPLLLSFPLKEIMLLDAGELPSKKGSSKHFQFH